MRNVVLARVGARGLAGGLAAAAMVTVLLAGCAESRRTNKDAWCTQFTDDSSRECSYRSLQQCLATISGVGGTCVANPRYSVAPR